MTDQERIEALEKKVHDLTEAYKEMAKAHNINGDQFFGVIDAIQNSVVSFQVLINLLCQNEILDEKEFKKYETTIQRLVKKRRLENLLDKEVKE